MIEQDPKPGAKAPKNSTINVKVSNGPPTAVVPDVTGESQDQATQDLAERRASRTCRSRQTDVADPTQDGIVQAQDPVRQPDGAD